MSNTRQLLADEDDTNKRTKIADEKVRILNQQLLQLQNEEEAYVKKSQQRLLSIRNELREAELERQRLNTDYETRCRKALLSIRQKLNAGSNVIDREIHKKANDFLHEAETHLSELNSKPNTPISKVKLLAENIELIDDTFQNVTSPSLNSEKLQTNWQSILTKSREMEESSASARTVGRSMMTLGIALIAIGVVGAIVGLAGAIPSYGFSLALSFASFSLVGAGIILINRGNDKNEKHQISGVPQKMLLFGDSVKDKISGSETDHVYFRDKIRRFFR